MEIDFIEESNVPVETIELIQTVLYQAAKEENVEENAEISVTFTTNEGIRRLNATYRGKDTATDVISFAMEEGEAQVQVEGMPRMLGDIIISTERAAEQADEYGHTVKREIAFLALHGFLHLLGYDHLSEADEKAMTEKQEQILTSLGLTRDAE